MDSNFALVFRSHKKQHTEFGRDSETLALKFKDVLALKCNLKGWFDGALC